MNEYFRASKRLLALGLFAVALSSSPSFANEGNDDLDSILNAPAMPTTSVFQSNSVQNDVFAQANALASRVANMYRDLRYQAYPDAPDASDIKVICTVTVRDSDSDSLLSTIKTAPRVAFGSPQVIPVPLSHVPRKLVSIVGKLAKDSLPLLRDQHSKLVEVMVQIKRNGSSQATVVVSADHLNGGVCTGVSFVSKDDALPNVTDVDYPAN
ncbi:MAG: hypothetical protein K2X29_02810 [Candidatus Obscuribacterales bacterium]|nr:hypothetical protein [Candidatus Obscuribacterales bacterium]